MSSGLVAVVFFILNVCDHFESDSDNHSDTRLHHCIVTYFQKSVIMVIIVVN